MNINIKLKIYKIFKCRIINITNIILQTANTSTFKDPTAPLFVSFKLNVMKVASKRLKLYILKR